MASIGFNVRIFQNVTIGSRYFNGDYPVIQNNVDIGPGAIILGNVCIGNFAKIGANSVVLNDVPDHATAVGVPARILHSN